MNHWRLQHRLSLSSSPFSISQQTFLQCVTQHVPGGPISQLDGTVFSIEPSGQLLQIPTRWYLCWGETIQRLPTQRSRKWFCFKPQWPEWSLASDAIPGKRRLAIVFQSYYLPSSPFYAIVYSGFCASIIGEDEHRTVQLKLWIPKLKKQQFNKTHIALMVALMDTKHCLLKNSHLLPLSKETTRQYLLYLLPSYGRNCLLWLSLSR